jgi:hypothetical protein
MTDPILARLAALKTTPTPNLKQQWRDLFDSEPPPFNRRYLESRLAYRIQELAYGGLKPETVKRLEELGDEVEADAAPSRKRRQKGLPIVGTRLIREWQGVEQLVTVTADGFDWQGQPYKSLSAIARAITGTRWNGWVLHRRDAAERVLAGATVGAAIGAATADGREREVEAEVAEPSDYLRALTACLEGRGYSVHLPTEAELTASR